MNPPYSLTIGYLYPDLLNTYGDRGNVIAFQKRAEWQRIQTTIKYLYEGSNIDSQQIDIYFIGGGQDEAQLRVAEDLFNTNKAYILKQEITRGIPMLAICGGFQLMGKSYVTFSGVTIKGVNIFPATTYGYNKRWVGPVLISTEFGNVVGFQNHAGQTHLHDDAMAFGKVIGLDNNSDLKFDGCRYENAIGTYLHGPLLPRNVIINDWLLAQSLLVKYGHTVPTLQLNDSWSVHAFNDFLQFLKKFKK